MSALAVLSVPQSDDDLASFLREQLEAIADELFARVYRPHQWTWDEQDCPWHRRLAEIGRSDAECPICTQIQRSRKARGNG